MPLRVVFMGTPDFSVPVLDAVVAAGHEVVAAYTRAPKPAGRGMDLRRSPVHVRADTLGIPVLTPKTLRSEEAQAAFSAHNADVAVVVAYGLLLPKPVLDAPRLHCLNLHASLLPRWRGAAPINRAVMAGDLESGVMVMKMEEGLDTGPVALTARVTIGPDMTAGELHDALSPLGAALMAEALGKIEDGSIAFVPQGEEGVTYASKITNEETRVDWGLPGRAVHDHVRGLSPFPGAWFSADLGKGEERIKLLRSERAEGSDLPGTLLSPDGFVACGEGAVRLVTVQRAGSKAMAFADFARGARLGAGFRFG
ncbi:methionyl-tRNA formyltransferase [Pleomorphomonas diazotrophica]|uniref:Methionyl-tRNA formyltransferase n=1 Tax=Pleomorphomonas diazotrophica TaxID=1166257 RepID=A0A1I4TCL2_9HYPH|nr:methionyl-tRNA formyltransferase [Pleomorphomonas diazotrophica]PKR89417.1 methionyl-tRNA formyltransferase [Pleomorphomonas diazotrophica]SFM74474.1 methionyl-tRNA formyltransferase [Pleomorphomonas diazotrophica]